MPKARIAALSCMLLACGGGAEPPLSAAKPHADAGVHAGSAAPEKPVDPPPPAEQPDAAPPPAVLPWPPTEEPPPPSGGETGSWTPTPCGGVSEPVSIELDAAAKLGFSAREVVSWLERGVDAPLTWTPRAAQSGESWQASGYEPRTRVEAILRATSIEHILPSPKYCDGTLCRSRPDGEPIDQATCPTQLRIHFTLALRTLDGALYVNTRGFMLMRSRDIGRPAAELEIGGSAFSEVRGQLELRDDARAHVTALSVELVLTEGQLSGLLRPTLVYTPPALPDLDLSFPSLSPQDRLRYGGVVPVLGEWPR